MGRPTLANCCHTLATSKKCPHYVRTIWQHRPNSGPIVSCSESLSYTLQNRGTSVPYHFLSFPIPTLPFPNLNIFNPTISKRFSQSANDGQQSVLLGNKPSSQLPKIQRIKKLPINCFFFFFPWVSSESLSILYTADFIWRKDVQVKNFLFLSFKTDTH